MAQNETDAAWNSAIHNQKRAEAAEQRIAELEDRDCAATVYHIVARCCVKSAQRRRRAVSVAVEQVSFQHLLNVAIEGLPKFGIKNMPISILTRP